MTFRNMNENVQEQNWRLFDKKIINYLMLRYHI